MGVGYFLPFGSLTPFNESAPGNQIQLNYGMFIDADWNVNTGVSGVDYQVEISGRNETWTKTFSQWSSVDSNRTLYKEHNYLSLFDYPEGGK